MLKIALQVQFIAGLCQTNRKQQEFVYLIYFVNIGSKQKININSFRFFVLKDFPFSSEKLGKSLLKLDHFEVNFSLNSLLSRSLFLVSTFFFHIFLEFFFNFLTFHFSLITLITFFVNF